MPIIKAGVSTSEPRYFSRVFSLQLFLERHSNKYDKKSMTERPLFSPKTIFAAVRLTGLFITVWTCFNWLFHEKCQTGGKIVGVQKMSARTFRKGNTGVSPYARIVIQPSKRGPAIKKQNHPLVSQPDGSTAFHDTTSTNYL